MMILHVVPDLLHACSLGYDPHKRYEIKNDFLTFKAWWPSQGLERLAGLEFVGAFVDEYAVLFPAELGFIKSRLRWGNQHIQASRDNFTT